MPTYVYRFVETGETIEVQQAFTDATLTEVAHPQSGQVMAVKKVFQPVGVTFRGSGFFKTDNRGKATAGATNGKSDGDGGSSSKESKPSTDSKAAGGSTSGTSDSKPGASSGSTTTSSSSTPSTD